MLVRRVRRVGRFSFPWFIALLATGMGVAFAASALVACGASGLDDTTVGGQDGSVGDARQDSALPVETPDAGFYLDAAPPLPSNCADYCGSVMANCTGEHAQYGSEEECLSFCTLLPPSEASRGGDEKKSASVACRQFYAGSPAKTDPSGYCLAAGPFGGNVCGDRCKAFCDVLLGACSPDGGAPAYGSAPDCASACANFTYRDAGSDGGGEVPSGPKKGDTLNCRLYWLRHASMKADKCEALHPDGGACHDKE